MANRTVTVTRWRYSNPMAVPAFAGTFHTDATYEVCLHANGWQHAADGSGGSRVYMRADQAEAYEIN